MSNTQRQLDNDVLRLNKLLDNVERVLKKDSDGLVLQTAVFALTSATKVTKPGDKSKISRMPKKFRFRPLVKMPDSAGFYYVTMDGTIFKNDSQISRKSMNRRKLKRVTKGIKVFNKKQRGFTYIPWIGTKDESDKKFKIPFAGAAKAGFLNGLKRLDKKPVDLAETGRSRKRYTRVTRRHGFVEIINLVAYAAKTSPGADRVGLHKATNRLEKTWIPRIERRIERDWQKNTNGFLKAVGKLG